MLTPTRDAAASIAAAVIRDRGLGTGVSAVYTVAELPFRRPRVKGVEPLEHCWIAYARVPVRGLHPSVIVLVDRVTGEVVYAGSANDEG